MTQATQTAPVAQGVAGEAHIRLTGVASLVVVYVSMWLVTGRYWGLEHDAQAYAVQALAKLNPGVLSGDLFLRFQSQDDYTLFPYLCAATIRWLGLDHGAATVTATLTLAWFWVAWHFARRLVGVRQAWLAVGLLLAFPCWYGAGQVFRTAEPFLSARPAAEVLCLVALVSMLSARRLTAGLCIAVALLVHPIMAFPGTLAALALAMHGKWARRTYGWPMIAAATAIAAIGGATLLGGGGAVMSDAWLADVRLRSNFLFPTAWSVADRQTAIVPIVTTLLAARLLSGDARAMALAVFWVGATGLALALFSDVVLPLKLLVQGQPWRWVWPGAVVAVVLLPGTVQTAWSRGGPDRASAMLLCASWALLQWSSAGDVPPIGISGVLVCLAGLLSVARHRIPSSVSTLLVQGAGVVLAGAVVGLILSVLAIVPGRFSLGIDPPPVQFASDVLAMPAAGALMVTLAWALTIEHCRIWTYALVGALGMALGLAAAPGAAATWTSEFFGGPERATFAGFRATIPVDAEVLWIDGLQETWFLVDRRSYLSVSQLGGIVFSEALASEARRRASILEPLVAEGFWFAEPGAAGPRKLTRDILARICAPGGPDFVVSDVDLGSAVSRAEWPTRAMSRYLYDCVRPQPFR